MSEFFGLALDLQDFDNLLHKEDLVEEPVPIEVFVRDRRYLGLEFDLSEIQVELAKHVSQIFKRETLIELEGTQFMRGLKMNDAGIIVPHNWSGDEYFDHYTVNEVVAQLGKGSGKDHTSRVSMAYLVYLLHCLRDPLEYYGKASGVYIDLVNLAVNAQQAQNVFFDPLKNILMNSPWAIDVGFEPRVSEIRWFSRPIRMFSGHSEAEGWEGYDVMVVVLDEISAFKIDAELKNDIRNKGSASVIYEMARASITSRFPSVGKVVLLSFPRFRNDFIQQRYGSIINDLKEQGAVMLDEKYGNRGVERERSTWGIKACTWEVNPTRHREEFDDEFRRDPIMAKARYMSVVAGEKVPTTRGLVDIEKVVVGDRVATRHGPNSVLASWMQADKKPCVEVELKSGRSIRCSEDHPIYNVTSKYYSIHREKYGMYAGSWRHAGLLVEGDSVLLSFGDSINKSEGKISVDEAYLIGLILADGNVRFDNRKYVQIACGESPEFAEKIFELFRSTFGSCQLSEQISKQFPGSINYVVRSDNVSVVKKIIDLGLTRTPANEKRIPIHLFTESDDNIKAFLNGFLDGDGYVRRDRGTIHFVSTSIGLLKDIQLLLGAIGIRGDIHVNRQPNDNGFVKSNHILFSLDIGKISSIKFYDFIDLKSKKSQNINIPVINGNRTNELIFDEVVGIKEIGDHYVYDIHVDNVEEFVCNNIVVHNCEPPEMVDAYFRDADSVRESFNAKQNPVDDDGHYKDWFIGSDEHARFIHVDLALGKRDRAALCMVHSPGMKQIKIGNNTETLPIVEMDYLEYWEAGAYEEINFADIRSRIMELARRFNVASVTFDRWNSADMIQALRAAGIASDMHSVAKKDYDTLSTAIYDQRFKGYWNEILVEHELLKLQLISANKIDHPTSGSKDLADALAGAVYMCVDNIAYDIEIDIEILRDVDYDEMTSYEVDKITDQIIKKEQTKKEETKIPESISDWLQMI